MLPAPWFGRRRLCRPSGRREHRLEDLRVRAAAADVAAEGLAHLFERWPRDGVQERLRGDDEPRRAEAALERVLLDERLLQRMELPGRSDSLDGRDRPVARVD